jgi:hypothetical protein
MNAEQQEQFEIYCEEFLESESWLPFHSPRNFQLVVQRARERVEAGGGFPSYAALELAAADLIGGNIIRRHFTQTPEEEAAARPVQPITLTASQYRSLPSSVVQRRYRQEPAFAAACDALFASGQV